jgi:sortase A
MSDLDDQRKEQIKEAAADLIRRKVSNIYDDEPGYKEELKEINSEPNKLSKHQKYVQELNASGKSSSEIQKLWHQYYENLPDDEKMQVWDEFYSASGQSTEFFDKVTKRVQEARKADNPDNVSTKVYVSDHIYSPQKNTESHKKHHLSHSKNRLVSTQKLKNSQHLKSLGFGLIAGTLAVLIFLFSFFNQVILVPFIQPSRNAIATPIILNTSGVSNITTPEIIIPKLNLQLPVNYTESSTNESDIENDLNSGVVHYPSTALPGENGNTAYFGHSSNNIFNPGKYKFAFVLLHTLEKGDTFYLAYNSKIFVYQVFSKTIVPPSDVSVLNPIAGHTATATLITCDPPGTSINRLVVSADQISPSITNNASTTSNASTTNSPTSLPGNGKSLWQRFLQWL